MKLRISHKTCYTYEGPVELNPHAIFLKPLQRPWFQIGNYQLKVFPSPEGMEERTSIEGNPFFQVWFKTLTDKLEVATSFEVEIREFNPFSFIIDLEFLQNMDAAADPVFRYDAKEKNILFPYLLTERIPDLYGFARELLRKNQDNLMGYLIQLTSEVHSGWKHIIREEENIWSPEETYAKKEGSCRDLAWMQIHMLRMQGMAARFVSGYAYNSELEEGHELHAWVEAYLPGAGWIGMDPSLGLFTNHQYIPLACSSEAEFTLPLHGNYGGTARSKLNTEVTINKYQLGL